jgi:hypothetical protein
MKIEKLQITKDKLDVNLKFYFFLKYINKINPSDRQIDQISENIGLFKKKYIRFKFIIIKNIFKITNKIRIYKRTK